MAVPVLPTAIAVALAVVIAGRLIFHWWRYVNVPALSAFFAHQHARGRDRLPRFARVLPRSPLGTLVTTLVSAAVGAAPDRTTEQVQAELTEVAETAERRFMAAMQTRMVVDVALLAAGLAVAAWFGIGAVAPGWTWLPIGAAIAGEGFVLWREIGVVRQAPAAVTKLVADLAHGVTAPPLPPITAPTSTPSPYRDTEAASAKPVVPRPVPRRCPWCGHGEFAQGEMVALRGVAHTSVDRSSDLPRHVCHAIVCLGCGRLEWFVQDPPALFGDGDVEARRPERMLRVRAVEPDDVKPGRSE